MGDQSNQKTKQHTATRIFGTTRHGFFFFLKHNNAPCFQAVALTRVELASPSPGTLGGAGMEADAPVPLTDVPLTGTVPLMIAGSVALGEGDRVELGFAGIVALGFTGVVPLGGRVPLPKSGGSDDDVPLVSL